MTFPAGLPFLICKIGSIRILSVAGDSNRTRTSTSKMENNVFTSSRMGRAGSLMFGLRGAGDSSTTGCVFHFPFPSPFRVFVHVGIIVRLAVPGEHGHRKPAGSLETKWSASTVAHIRQILEKLGLAQGVSLVHPCPRRCGQVVWAVLTGPGWAGSPFLSPAGEGIFYFWQVG